MEWTKWFSRARARASEEQDDQRLLQDEEQPPSYPPAEVTKIALRLKYQIEQVVPCELEEWKITKANSPIITSKVIAAAKSAGGKEYPSCVIYCLLVCHRWFQRQAVLELWDAELYHARAVACEVLAKKIIESEGDEEFLMQELLLRRYAILVRGEKADRANAVERAVDLHALRVIGSSGYQKCVNYLWRGWLIQDEFEPSCYKEYAQKANPDYWAHFNPDRMRTPQFQNAVQISVSLIYLILYTIAINTINKSGDLDVIEGILYVFTAGFIFDELSKLWKVGRYYISFWNIFNSVLYSLLLVSFVLRVVALSHPLDTADRDRLNILSYNFLAFSAPMFWMRLLLYLDAIRFLGAMLVILKNMMKESAIFFLLLVLLCVGFLQAFIGLDSIDNNDKITTFIIQSMANSVMQSPDFSGFAHFAPPFGTILYYIFTFLVMVILLNVLIALYNSAYESVTDNADDEYMALFASKTLQFVRAPDENVFIAPFNLIEIFLLIIPFEWWLSDDRYETLNDVVMGLIYSPLLLVTAHLEARAGRQVLRNRRLHEDDADTTEEWEELGPRRPGGGGSQDADELQPNGGETQQTLVDFEADGWAKKVEGSKPDVNVDATLTEVRELRAKIEELMEAIKGLKEGKS